MRTGAQHPPLQHRRNSRCWACVLLVAKRATTTESALADASELMKDLELHGEEGPGFVAEVGAMLGLMMDGNAKH